MTDTPMTPDRLSQIQNRNLDEVTDGPWLVADGSGGRPVVYVETLRDGRTGARVLLSADGASEADVQFIASARQSVPELLAEVDRLRRALSEAAAWLVRAGYPVDWSAHEPPPDALREAVVDAVHADPTGTVHGGELTRDEVAAWLAVEVRAFAHPDGEPTP
ncbi:hypothetical protein ACIBQ3_32500 [Streptomyces rubiginosohelvolus]|uniref:hypothetical protein n=1 Tax=Streptomyces rubiginosohelvolus TaxID=67362 RepID=UPI0037B5E4DB